MVCKCCRKVVGTGQIGEREAGLQEQMLSIAGITHAIAEVAGHGANREKGDAAREYAHRVEIGRGAEPRPVEVDEMDQPRSEADEMLGNPLGPIAPGSFPPWPGSMFSLASMLKILPSCPESKISLALRYRGA